MIRVGQREIHMQRRVFAFFRNALGYSYPGHWQDRYDFIVCDAGVKKVRRHNQGTSYG